MEQIADWLGSLGLGQYAQCFVENDIDRAILGDLTDQDLEKIGVSSLGHRRKLLRAIAELKDADKSASTAATTTVAPSEPRPPDTAERRHVTVMFSDLVGSTALSARMDPEDLRELISAYQKCVAETVRRFDGFLAKYMGDGVLVYFGYPQAHEDDAERAVRAGLELITAVTRLKARVALQTRVGIATGLVVVGDLIGAGAAQEQAVVGETPNLAARLQGIAEPDMVVIAESTRRLLGNLFELEDLGARDLKGIAGPARAWAALRASAVESRFEALHATGLTALVGREEETELLLRRWSRAKTREGQVVLLSGEAGIGKSRLTAALLERLAGEPHTRLRYFCSPQHSDSALFQVIGQIAAGLGHDDTLQERLGKLDAVLAQTSTSSEDAGLFAEMLSLPNDGRYPALDLAPQQRRQKTLTALISQLEALTRRNPVLMVFEDAHWTDPTSLELFGRIVDRLATLPALLIVTFRPEFATPWIGRPHVTALTINRLGQREVGAMIDRVVGNKLLPVNIRQDIIERTDGIPLFVEEMTKAVLEAESEGAAHQMAAAVPSPTLAVPATLHASLMARLDRLGPAKEVAQIGAAIGREFSHVLIAALLNRPEPELASALERLVEAGLLFRQGLPPHATYLFKHALVQDAAYGTLLREPRRALHTRIAEVIESELAEIAENQPEVLARHCSEAGLAEKAVGYWLRAGRNAAARYANVEAIAHLRRGIDAVEHLHAGPTRDRVDLDLQLALGPCVIATQGPASSTAASIFSRARQLCERLGDPPEYLQVMHWLMTALAMRGQLPEALEASSTLLGLAEGRGDRPAMLNALRAVGLVNLLMGRLTDAFKLFERTVKEFDASSEAERSAARSAGQDAGAAGLAVMSWVLWLLGRLDDAAARIVAALQRADAVKDPHTQAYVCYYASVLYALRGEPAIARQHAERCLTLSEERGFRIWRDLSHAVRGICTAVLEPSSAIDQVILDELHGGYQFGITAPFILLCEALLFRDQLDAALETIEQGLSKCSLNNERVFEAELHRLKARVVLLGTEPDAGSHAQSLLEEALTIARSQSARSLELRAARDLADLWRGQGRLERAHDLLAPIHAWFTEGLDTRDLKEAAALLEKTVVN
jgi:class 3 adenylate cyclase/tetratricopeptide (TPR) repeat protein